MARYITRELGGYNRIIKGCPIVLDKTRLLYDTETLDLIFQISLRNISEKNIKTISFFANYYNELGDLIKNNEKIVLNGNFLRMQKFSTNEPIIIDNSDVYSISLIIESVIFDDDSTWINKEKREGTKIVEKQYIDNYQLIEAFKKKELSIPLCNYPVFTDDYYICSCGKINEFDSKFCTECGLEKELLAKTFDNDNISMLIDEYNRELEIEYQKIEKEREEQRQKRKKELFKFLKVFSIIVLVIIIAFIIYKVVKNIVCYNKGLSYYENNEYKESIDMLTKINTEKSKILLDDVYYDYGIYLKEGNNCTAAIRYFDLTNKEVSDVIRDECYIALGDEALELGEYDNAIEYYQLVRELSNDSQLDKAYFEYGNYYYELENYVSAILYFEKGINYKDSKTMLNKAKMDYINDHFDIKDTATEKYIDDLVKENYPGSKDVYSKLTKWNIEIYANTISYSSTKSTSISRYSPIYIHVKLTGGKKNEEIPLKYKVYYPDGSVSKMDSFEDKFRDGGTGYVYWSYGDYNAGKGNLTIVFYNGNTSKELGRHTVKIT